MGGGSTKIVNSQTYSYGTSICSSFYIQLILKRHTPMKIQSDSKTKIFENTYINQGVSSIEFTLRTCNIFSEDKIDKF